MQIAEKDLINPLRKLGYTSDNILTQGGFGAVTARAGVGKTSFMVQIALNAMLRKKSVLHISLDDPVKKINIWYKEVFQRFCENSGNKQYMSLWEEILPYRFIMTLQVDGFRVSGLEERIKDLTVQNIFTPDLMVIDGLPFDDSTRGILSDFKLLTQKSGMVSWFSVRTHRHESPMESGLPPQLAELDDLFESIIHLQPEGREIHIRSLKGGDQSVEKPVLRLDPSSMLFQE